MLSLLLWSETIFIFTLIMAISVLTRINCWSSKSKAQYFYFIFVHLLPDCLISKLSPHISTQKLLYLEILIPAFYWGGGMEGGLGDSFVNIIPSGRVCMISQGGHMPVSSPLLGDSDGSPHKIFSHLFL